MIGFLQSVAYALPSFLFVIIIVITIHELGHFWAGKLFRVRIERFSLGFGPTMFARRSRKTGTEWRIAWLPFGGYVKFAGDANAAGVPDANDLAELKASIIDQEGPAAVRDYYHFKPVWQRAVIAAAGPFANFLLATVIFAATYGIFGEATYPTRVEAVTPSSPAAAAGFKPGDRILRAGGDEIVTGDDFVRVVRLNADSPVPVTVDRAGTSVELVVTPKRAIVSDSIGGKARMGQVGLQLALPKVSEISYRRYNPIQAVGRGANQAWSIVSTTLSYLGRVVSGKENGDQLSGPVGTAAVAGKLVQSAAQAEGGFGLKAASVLYTLIQFVAFVSVGIGFLNLLPIPVLDGGHLLFYAYESVARKPLAARVQEISMQVGLALIVGLMLFANWNDLQKFLLGGLSS